MTDPLYPESQELDSKTKIELLKYLHRDQREEIHYRREREYRVFTWSSSILLILIGALLITKQSENIVWEPYGNFGSVGASLAVVLLVAFSIRFQFKNHKYRGQNARIVARINMLLHCFDEGFFDSEETSSLFPKNWIYYGRHHDKLRDRLFQANFTAATFLLGVIAVAMIWIP